MSVLDSLFGKKEAAAVSDTLNGMTSSVSNIVSEVNPLDSLTAKEKTQLSDKLNKVTVVIGLITLFAVPVLAIPILADTFDLPKQTLLFALPLVGLILWALSAVLTKKLSLTLSPLHLPVVALAIVALISTFFTDNRYAAIVADTVLLSGCAFLFVLLSSSLNKEALVKKAVTLLLISGAVLSTLTLVQIMYTLVGIQAHLPALFIFNPAFSLTGSPLSQAMFLVTLIPLALGLYFESKNSGTTTALSLLTLNVLGLLLTGYLLYQNHPILLDYTTGWKIAASSLGQSLTSALVGVGPGHYIDAFTAGKPIDFNTSTFWNLRFSTSSSYLFYLLTTLGIAGLAALTYLVFRFVQIARARLAVDNVSSFEKSLLAAVALNLILLVVLPGPIVTLFSLFALLGLLIAFYRTRGISLFAREVTITSQQYHFAFLIVAALILFAAMANPIPNSLNLSKVLIGDYFFAQSLSAAAANNGQATYNNQIQALNFNPWNSAYRISYSQTNLALANAIAGQPNLSDQQKQIVIQLVQQALREGRLAVSLQPRRAGNWENLSLIYRNLINFAQGADQWSVASENQAVTYDPANPRLRLDMGGILYAVGDYQNAAQIFNQAANLKPDYANAHYNLAQALKQLKIDDQALQQLQLTGTLVCSTPAGNQSADCQKVNTEISDLTKQIANNKQAGTVAGAATPSATPVTPVKPTENQAPLATPGAATRNSNLPRAKTTPPAQVSSKSGEIQPNL